MRVSSPTAVLLKVTVIAEVPTGPVIVAVAVRTPWALVVGVAG